MSIRNYTDLERTALQWWRSHRPTSYTLRVHIIHPEVNCQTDDEQSLARACADLAKERIEELDRLVDLEWVDLGLVK